MDSQCESLITQARVGELSYFCKVLLFHIKVSRQGTIAGQGLGSGLTLKYFQKIKSYPFICQKTPAATASVTDDANLVETIVPHLAFHFDGGNR